MNQGMAMNFDMSNMGMFGGMDSNPYIFSFGLNQMGFQNAMGNPMAQMGAGMNVQPYYQMGVRLFHLR